MIINFVLVDVGLIKEAEPFERLAFEKCDTDQSGCLTWDEVEECTKNLGFPLSKELFYEMAGEDGCLTFDEWMEWQVANF